MVLDFLATLFSRKYRLPRDQVTRVPRAARKAVQPHVAAMVAAIEKIGALPGVADIKERQRVPRGFYDLVDEYIRAFDAYIETAAKFLPVEGAKRAGEPGGCNACFAAPMGMSTIEALGIYRKLRPWRDFPQVAQRLAELGEQQFKDIQTGVGDKDPSKIRMGSRSVQQGRIAFAKRKVACPLLDATKERCRAWEFRPTACRMHHALAPFEAADPAHPDYPRGAKATNIRLPAKVQIALYQLDKRLMLQLSPFLYASMLQLVQLGNGGLIQEIGEAPLRLEQGGTVAQRANRNVAHAKKFKKKK